MVGSSEVTGAAVEGPGVTGGGPSKVRSTAGMLSSSSVDGGGWLSRSG